MSGCWEGVLRSGLNLAAGVAAVLACFASDFAFGKQASEAPAGAAARPEAAVPPAPLPPAYLVGSIRVFPTVVDSWLREPRSLLAAFPAGGIPMADYVWRLAASDSRTVGPLVALGRVAGLSPDQETALGSGLARVVLGARIASPRYADYVAAELASSRDQELITAFEAALRAKPVAWHGMAAGEDTGTALADGAPGAGSTQGPGQGPGVLGGGDDAESTVNGLENVPVAVVTAGLGSRTGGGNVLLDSAGDGDDGSDGSASAAPAAYLSGAERLSEDAVNQWLQQPDSIFSTYPAGGLPLSNFVRHLAGSDNRTVEELVDVAKDTKASSAQVAAIGAGLARAAQGGQRSAPLYAVYIQQRVALSSNSGLIDAFLAALSDQSVAALGVDADLNLRVLAGRLPDGAADNTSDAPLPRTFGSAFRLGRSATLSTVTQRSDGSPTR